MTEQCAIKIIIQLWILIVFCLQLVDSASFLGDMDEYTKWSRKCKNRGQVYCLTNKQCVSSLYDCLNWERNEKITVNTTASNQRSVLCETWKKKCDSDAVCYDNVDICDGVLDCADGADEMLCPECERFGDTIKKGCKKCLGTFSYSCDVRFSHRSCYSVHQRCDRNWDCIDGSDERNCPGSNFDRSDFYMRKMTAVAFGIVLVAVLSGICSYVNKKRRARLRSGHDLSNTSFRFTNMHPVNHSDLTTESSPVSSSLVGRDLPPTLTHSTQPPLGTHRFGLNRTTPGMRTYTNDYTLSQILADAVHPPIRPRLGVDSNTNLVKNTAPPSYDSVIGLETQREGAENSAGQLIASVSSPPPLDPPQIQITSDDSTTATSQAPPQQATSREEVPLPPSYNSLFGSNFV